METDRTTYEKTVRDHLAHMRQMVPIVKREKLSSLAKQQYQILGGDLIQWHNNVADDLLSERAFLGKMKGWDPNPVGFFISTMPGLVAIQEILGGENERFVWGLPKDFKLLEDRDEENIFHVEYVSLFKKPRSKAALTELAKSHPLATGESYYIHAVESVMGPLFVRGVKHLWKWDGKKLDLLEEGWRMWVS